MKSNESLKALFVIFKKGGDYVESAFEEAELLGISVSEDDIHFYAYAVNKFGDLASAQEFCNSADEEAFKGIVSNQRERYEQALKKQGEELARIAAQKSLKKSEDLASSRFDEIKKLMEMAVDKLDAKFKDYTVISSIGDDISELRQPVKRALSDGWVPIGGIHIVGPLDNGVMLFSQAMGLPEREPDANF